MEEGGRVDGQCIDAKYTQAPPPRRRRVHPQLTK